MTERKSFRVPRLLRQVVTDRQSEIDHFVIRILRPVGQLVMMHAFLGRQPGVTPHKVVGKDFVGVFASWQDQGE